MDNRNSKGAAGASDSLDTPIRWSVGQTGLGPAVVGITERGVCAVLFTEENQAEAALRTEFPYATLERDDEGVRPHLEQISEVLAGQRAARSISLDLIGTDFQREVWTELLRIPAGETATYSQVASRIGRPRAVRAVASACASNHVAGVVPCHRVVRSDGSLGGFKWGAERKRSLLRSESR